MEDELKPIAALDVEVFSNYFAVLIQPADGSVPFVFEQYDGCEIDVPDLRQVLRDHTIVTFNGNHFDAPLLSLAMKGASCEKLKEAANLIISRNMQPWQFEKRFLTRNVLPSFEHIDLIEVAPGKASLKIYGGRLHTRKMQDLPYDHDKVLTPEEMEAVRLYCANDLEVTLELYHALEQQVALRAEMSRRYGVDLRSKSDAQIAEAVIKHELEVAGVMVEKPLDMEGKTFRYRRPEFMEFKRPELQKLMAEIEGMVFVVNAGGKVDDRDLRKASVKIGNSVYRLGIGGLHSSESNQAVVPDPLEILFDVDVESYYPRTILEQRLSPPMLGEKFLEVYESLVTRRLDAKHAGDKTTSDTLKIVINGSFGKFGSKWSFLYSPDLLIQTTLTGQLALLMLIEMFEDAGLTVVSANTDGVVVYGEAEQEQAMRSVVSQWEFLTGYICEANRYSALYSRDVNNYVALKPDGGAKLKGVFARGGLMKNPVNLVCTDAVIEKLIHGTPVEDTIRACQDVRRFITIRTVKGGAVKDGADLGRAVRWYYARGVEGTINYKLNGYKVPRSEGARPLMDLPAELPADVDHDWYITEANSMLQEIGYA